jgi:hypothetical protein
MWIRADPKGRSNFKYTTYTSLAVSIKGDTLPDDVYNRGIRINMTTKPDGMELADLDNCEEDDGEGDPTSPAMLRTELYAIKMYSTAMRDSANWAGDTRLIDFREQMKITKQHFTTKTESGQWMYAQILGMPLDSPQIRDRSRKIATTLYSVGLATHSEDSVIQMIIKQDEANKELTADTPEALTFMALYELVEEGWKSEGALNKKMSLPLFLMLLDKITTTQVAERYNLILTEQGNADREPVKTSRVTATLNALGLTYRRGVSNKSYMYPGDSIFIPNWLRCISKYIPRQLCRYSVLIEERVK